MTHQPGAHRQSSRRGGSPRIKTPVPIEEQKTVADQIQKCAPDHLIVAGIELAAAPVPAKVGRIVGEATVTQLGKTVAFVEGRLTADDGTVLATASASARLVETAKAIR
jgi:hypothetical protein